VAHRLVAESAVVSKPHEIKVSPVFAYVVLMCRAERRGGEIADRRAAHWVGEQ